MITPFHIAMAEARLLQDQIKLAVSDMFIDVMADSPVLSEIGREQANEVRATEWRDGRLHAMAEAAAIGHNIRHAIERDAIAHGNAGGPAIDAALAGLFDLLSWQHIGAHFQQQLED